MPRRHAAALASMLLAVTLTAASAQTVDELYSSGVKARQAQKLDEAADLLTRALALKPDNADALVQLGFAELGRGNLAPARAAFSKALSLAPDYWDARFGLAEIEFRSGNPDKALALAEPVVRAQPGNKDAAALLANIRKAQQAQSDKRPDRVATAAAARNKPSAKRPDPVTALMDQGRKLRASGRLAEAEAVYRKALRLAPRDTDALVALGLTEGSQQKFEEAGRSFDAVLAIHPGLMDARLGKVRLAVWQGDVARARKLIDEILPSAPRNAEAMALDGRIALLEGDHDRAQGAFQAALAANPEDAEALAGIGDVRRARGDDEGARQAYRQALSLEPGSKDIEDRLAQPPPRKWRLDIGSEVSDLTGGRGTWTDSSVGIAYKATSRTTVSARSRLATRYGRTDVQIEGRIDQAFSQSFSAYALAAASPHSDFLARYSVGAGASWQALAPLNGFGPLLLNVDTRYDRFTDTGITTVSPWMQGYLFDGRLGLSARWVHAFDDGDARADGYVLRADFAATPKVNLFVGYGDAPEIDDGSLVPTRTVFGGASWDVLDDLTVRASLAREQRPAFDRNIFGFGITKRF
ncbi:YaiO family outer membrane beta-barrel protein [Mesorhizobium sp. SP-1A]|uniref:YaiO family outer membrane beta-barrel protein n=1 Tax=Mesorhizobium sp. SP-1A TaxID=3077840 RepID=UPI0028F6C7E0|nr:YaiO family outer membrane beta-barrel protein [Mesorhizobium sp. SP-1A]